MVEDLNTIDNVILYNDVISKAVTIIKNDKQLLPLKKDNNKNFAYLKLGNGNNTEFLSALKNYIEFDVFVESKLKASSI